MVALSAIVWLPVADVDTSEDWLLVLDVALGLSCYVLVFFRRRWPVPIALVIAAASAVSGTTAGPAVLAAVSVSTRRRWREIALVGSANFAAAQFFSSMHPSSTSDPAWLTIILNALATAGMLGWGMYIGSRRELIWTLRSRAERAEAEQGLRVARARSNEQARIAREMHDVLAHRISQVSMHAGALAFREDLTADEMRASAAVIQQQAHEALNDLRGVLGVLRDDATGERFRVPQPTYDDLPRLLEEARESGVRVDLRDRLEVADVPDAVGRTVYRIVQEGLTNAGKHAPGAQLSVEISGSRAEGVDVLLRNPIGFGPTRTPGAGLGLIGLSERAELRGGHLEHGLEGSTFVLHAWIPWAA